MGGRINDTQGGGTALTYAYLIAAALLSAVLSGMGVGGGGLFIIYLTFAASLPQKTSQLYNLIFFLAASVASMPIHALRRRLDYKIIFLLALGGIVGALLGTQISKAVSGGSLRCALGGFFVVCGAASLLKSAKGDSLRRKKR